MRAPLPLVLVPGLNCSARLYADQIPVLWRFGPVQVADHTRDDSMDAIAMRILVAAPPRFALVGLSMGGYIAQTIIRQAPERVEKLALLDTSARPETPEQTARRKPHRARRERTLRRGAGVAVSGICPPRPARRRGAQAARAPHGGGDRSGGLPAPAARHHCSRRRAAIIAVDQMSDPCSGRRRRRADAAVARAGTRRRHTRVAVGRGTRLRAPLHHGAAGGSQCSARSVVGTLKSVHLRPAALPVWAGCLTLRYCDELAGHD